MGLICFISRSKKLEEEFAAARPRLLRLALSWAHDRSVADDLVQETYAKALSRQGQLRDPEAANAWLCTILANCWHDHLRRRKGRTMVDIEDISEGDEQDYFEVADGPEDECLHNEMVRRVRQAVGDLPGGQREVITLVDLEEFSYAEVAAILNIPIGTVMSRLSRARGALRDRLREQRSDVAVVHRLRG